MRWQRVRKSVVDVIISAFTNFGKSKDKQEKCRAYLLRCWQEGKVRADHEPLWRFSVEDVFGERPKQGFGSLEALISFLRVELTEHDHE